MTRYLRAAGAKPRRLARAAARGALWLAFAAALSQAACIHMRPSPPGEENEDVVFVRITNNNPLDITVYAVNLGVRHRIGTVSSAASGSFQLALHDVGSSGDLQLVADPIGARRTTTTQTIHVSPGQTIFWVLAADLRQSSLTVRSD